MRIVQSYWSKPSLENEKYAFESRLHGGWLNATTHHMSLALSCLKFRQWYDEVVLYTDRNGKEFLIDWLQLPFTDCIVTLDDINTYDASLWALGKIYTYSLQKEPFFHVDGDIFIFQPFSDKFIASELIAQNMELFECYHDILPQVLQEFDYIPEEIQQYTIPGKNIGGLNAGIIGGQNVNFFKKYTEEAFRFVDNNLKDLDKINKGMFNICYEQYLYHCMAKNDGLEVSCLFEDVSPDFRELMQFQLLPYKMSYIHMVGMNAKRSPLLCEQIALRLRMEFPEYYDRIISINQENLIKTQPVHEGV